MFFPPTVHARPSQPLRRPMPRHETSEIQTKPGPSKFETAPAAASAVTAPSIPHLHAPYFSPAIPTPWVYTPYAAPPAPQPDDHHPDQPHEDANVEGTFTLDSAAHPTHIKTPPNTLPRINNLSTRTAANHTTPCTHAGPIQIRLHPNHPPLRVPCVATEALHSNLLSVRDTALQYGAVLFTPQNGYILNLRDPYSPLVITTARWHKNKYTLCSHPFQSPSTTHAFGARTIPRQRHYPRSKTPSTPKTKPSTAPVLCQTPSLPSKRYEKPLITPLLNTMPLTHGAPAPNPTVQSFFHWHVVLNHVNLKKLQRMALNNTLPLLPDALRQTPPPITCSTCPTAKQIPQPHPRCTHQQSVGSYISIDTFGPFTPRSRHGNLHFVTYIDARSRYLIVFFIPDRSSVKHTTPLSISFITAQHVKPSSIYRTDNAREFQSNDMNNFYNIHGIQYRSNTPHQPQENSLAERINHTLVAATRAALHHSHLDESFWEDAMRDAIFKYNLTLHDSTGNSPYQLWHNKTPNLPRLFAFGQLGTIPHYPSQKKKLEPRAHPARFMHNTSPTHNVALNLRTNQYTHLRSIDFKPYFHHLDPLYHHPQSLSTTIPPTITEHTPPPTSLNHARQYPDHEQWAKVTSYADAGFANSNDRKSYTGIIHILTRSPIMWQSAKQKTVALSTCEAEYLSASTAAQQSLWLRRLLTDIAHKPSSATSLFLDNNAAIQVARHTAPTKHRKYIDLRCHFLHNLVKTDRTAVKHVPSTQMLADILTKPLKPQRFRTLRSALNIVPPP